MPLSEPLKLAPIAARWQALGVSCAEWVLAKLLEGHTEQDIVENFAVDSKGRIRFYPGKPSPVPADPPRAETATEKIAIAKQVDIVIQGLRRI